MDAQKDYLDFGGGVGWGWSASGRIIRVVVEVGEKVEVQCGDESGLI